MITHLFCLYHDETVLERPLSCVLFLEPDAGNTVHSHACTGRAFAELCIGAQCRGERLVIGVAVQQRRS